MHHSYIDGFAGAGLHRSKTTGEEVAGSPINVTSVEPPFKEYHLVELDPEKVAHLRSLFSGNDAVKIHPGDCNSVLLNHLLPAVKYSEYRRAFCLLDPYGLHLDWKVIRLAGTLQTIDLLLYFPMMDMNMNVLWQDPSAVKSEQAARLTRYWGDESWRSAAYRQEPTLFGSESVKTDNETVVRAFCERMKSAGGFKFVAEPLPMKNTIGKTIYYLLFASQKQTAHKIINDIFRKQRKLMGV